MTTRPTPWSAVLSTQWSWSRGMAFLTAALLFALPLLSIRVATTATSVALYISAMQTWGIVYAVIAAGLGLAMALAAWGNDHRLRHVYALALPIARWRYVLLRFGSGLVILAVPVAALLVAAEIAAHSGLVPRNLQAYPLALTFRFALATLVAYAIFFAISAATPRTAGYVLGSLVLLIVAQMLISAMDLHVNILTHVGDVLFASPGVLAVFVGRWALIDV